MNTPLRHLALQAACAVLVLSLLWPYFGFQVGAIPWAETSFLIGLLAFTVACFTRQPPWWRLIHALFAPLAWAVSQWSIDPGWFLLAFILLLLVYRGALTGQVPLYLTNADTVDALEELLAKQEELRLADLGAGIGSILLPLARRFPQGEFVGIENAPLTWLLGWWRCRAQPNLDWRWGNYWALGLGRFNVVYAFLSPAPMAELWQKVKAELPAGGIFISNSFPVPDVTPDEVIEVDGRPGRTLFCYRR